MAACALKFSRAQISVAVTGIAGPGGGTAEKPVGLVHFAAAKLRGRDGDRVEFAAIHYEERFGDIGRAEVRRDPSRRRCAFCLKPPISASVINRQRIM